jgi:L-seryl-tRNA(Ser) seleniumtransferase
VDALLKEPEVSSLIPLYGPAPVRVQVRAALEALRASAAGLGEPEFASRLESLANEISAGLASRAADSTRRVLNATGVFLHTNLGRAPLPTEVLSRMVPLLDAGCDLEMDLLSGRRGARNRRVEKLLIEATGAEAALVVNNNAAAVTLALAALAAGREVLVSRGELVEIGGSFRIPEILAAAGARLVEVGTTNRTRLADYERACGPQTGAILKVHPSNYRILGFTAAVDEVSLQELASRRGVPFLVDEGSGLLTPRAVPQLRDHPSMAELVKLGATAVCGSGDKLIGGPQAGILVGRQDAVERCHRHPLYRAFRPGRAVLVGLELILTDLAAGRPMPIDRLWPDPSAHAERLRRFSDFFPQARQENTEAFLGGGAAPERGIPGQALSFPADNGALERLRLGSIAVLASVREGRLWVDLRTVDPQDDRALATALAELFEYAPS